MPRNSESTGVFGEIYVVSSGTLSETWESHFPNAIGPFDLVLVVRPAWTPSRNSFQFRLSTSGTTVSPCPRATPATCLLNSRFLRVARLSTPAVRSGTIAPQAS